MQDGRDRSINNPHFVPEAETRASLNPGAHLLFGYEPIADAVEICNKG